MQLSINDQIQRRIQAILLSYEHGYNYASKLQIIDGKGKGLFARI